MSKYVKQNEIKAGIRLFIVHPKFNYIEAVFVGGNVRNEKSEWWDVTTYKAKSKGFDVADNGFSIKEFGFTQGFETKARYCGDDGIPDKNGNFSYKQQRRAFKTLNAALKYWRDGQTPENLEKWAAEDDEFKELWGDSFDYL